MTRLKLNATVISISLITLLVLSLALLDQRYFILLTTSPNTLSHFEYWRWLTCNFVHFGWAHTLIDTLGYALVSLILFYSVSVKRYLALVVFCSLAIGMFISVVDPQIDYYAGLSGVIHGLLIAGCFYATDFPLWKRLLVLFFTLAKLVQEQLPGFDINPVTNLMPVPIAVDAHLIGAIAGLIFIGFDKLISSFNNKKAIGRNGL
jgi:rhomboid family GlyGly-CTERM serine protease